MRYAQVSTMVLLSSCFALTSHILPAHGQSAERSELALSLLGLGGSTAKLVWVSTVQPELPPGMKPTVYSKLAIDLRAKIEQDKAVSSLVKANFDVISSGIAVMAVADPEPTSKIVLGLAAWGADKTGEYIVNMQLEEAQKRNRATLVQGLKESSLSADEFSKLSADQIKTHVSDFKIGGQQIREILNDEESLEILQNQAIELVENGLIESISRADYAAKTADDVRNDLNQTKEDLRELQQVVLERTTAIEARVDDLVVSVGQAHEKLSALQEAVKGNTKAIASIAEISFSGWSTLQKINAVQSDLLPNLNPQQKEALLASLRSDQRQEQIFRDVSRIASDLQSLGNIASNLGLPKDVIQATNVASTIASASVAYLSGNPLGAISAVTSLAGMGRPDPAAERHRIMMAYLAQQFEVINKKLDRIIELQVKTLESINSLRQEQQKFRAEVLTQLKRIEAISLSSHRILQALLKAEWKDCDAFSSASPISGTYTIENREALLNIVGNNVVRAYASKCYSTMTNFFDRVVKPGSWSGQVVAAQALPDETIAEDDEALLAMNQFQRSEALSYQLAANVLMNEVGSDKKRYPLILARLVQPAPTANDSAALSLSVDEQPSDVSLNCGRVRTILNEALAEILCFGAVNSAEPQESRFSNLVKTALLGPQAEIVLKQGVLLATIADLSIPKDGTIEPIDAAALAGLNDGMLPEGLQIAQRQKMGLALLRRLQWLTEYSVIQQATTYGDFTSAAAEKALYNKDRRALDTERSDPTDKKKAEEALAAMRANPVLARNVVLLGIRHAIADRMGGTEAAENGAYSETRFKFAIGNILRGNVCEPDELALTEWRDLLPNWSIEYVATSTEKGDPAFANCRVEQAFEINKDKHQPALGNGLAVRFDDALYVPLPSTFSMTRGILEQPPSLHRALALRDWISEQVSDRQIQKVLSATVDSEGGSDRTSGQVAFDMLNARMNVTQRSSR